MTGSRGPVLSPTASLHMRVWPAAIHPRLNALQIDEPRTLIVAGGFASDADHAEAEVRG